MSVDISKLAQLDPSSYITDTLFYADTWGTSLTNTAFTSWLSVINISYSNNQQGLPIGIYSIDGDTWYDMNGFDGPISMNIKSLSDGTAEWTATVISLVPGYAAGATVPITFKFALMSIQDTEILRVPIGGGAVLAYHTGVNAQKIALRGEIPALGSHGTITIPHNLGYVPTFRIWKRNTASPNAIASFAPATGFIGFGFRMDATNLYIDCPDSDTGSYIYRIYLD